MTRLEWEAELPDEFNDAAMRREILSGLRSLANEIKKDFLETTKTWSRDVQFYERVREESGGISLEVGTDDPIYAVLDAGVTPRKITPKRVRVLKFPRTFSSKTLPGVLSSRAGHISGDYVYSTVADDWQIESRKFVATVYAKWFEGESPPGMVDMEDIVDDGGTKSGYCTEKNKMARYIRGRNIAHRRGKFRRI
jgi:hypothetical protein